jgi:hypothetical protein
MTTHQSKAAKLRTRVTSDLLGGFRSLTLDPSPQLRRSRESLANRRPMASAWTVVGKAMRQSTDAVGRTIRP